MIEENGDSLVSDGIYLAGGNIGGMAIMTDPNLPSGTDRVYSAYNLLEKNNVYDKLTHKKTYSE